MNTVELANKVLEQTNIITEQQHTITAQQETIEQLQAVNAEQQSTIDSLRIVNAEQQTTISQLTDISSTQQNVLAKESTSQSILNAVSTIDVSALAKQGSDDTISLTSVSNTLSPIAQEYTAGKQAIVDALQSYGVECSMEDSLGELASKINQVGLNIEGIRFTNVNNNKLADLLLHPEKITEFITDIPFTVTRNGFLYSLKNAQRIECSGVVTMTGTNGATMPTKYETLIFKNLTTCQCSDGRTCGSSVVKIYDFGFCTNRTGEYSCITINANNRTLRHFRSGGMLLDGESERATCLYDIYLRILQSSSRNWAKWRPYEALSNSTTLLTKDEWDDPNEPTETFTCNRDKFMWYFEYHFIPCFTTVTNNPTLTLYTAVYNAISTTYSKEQPTKTLLELLTDKGWYVASAS